jgi:hypothetical protein
LVLLVPPGHAGLDLFKIHVLAIQENDADFTFVEVKLSAVRNYVFAEYHPGQAGL